MLYKNGSKDANAALLIGIGEKLSANDSFTLLVDSSRDLVVRSTSGTDYTPSIGVDWNKIQKLNEFLRDHTLEEARYVYLQNNFGFGTPLIKANDTVEVVIPLKNTADAT